ncbi:ATP-binding cassette glutathione S-conjugate transporter ycf1, partial [Dipsacomyces acuminosporus]
MPIKTKRSYHYNKYVVRQALDYMTTLYSRVSSVASGSLAVWLIYKKIGWIVAVPLCTSFFISGMGWCISKLKSTSYIQYRYLKGGAMLIKEIYFGMKSIKFYGWERKYLDPELMNYDERKDEDKNWYDRVILAAEFVTQILHTISESLSVYIAISLHLQLSPSLSNGELFTLMNQINSMRRHVFMIYRSVQRISALLRESSGLESSFSGARFEAVPRSEELTELGASVELTNCSFKRQKNTVLRGVSFSACGNELVAVMGKVASGKSSLLLAICGEVEMSQGSGQVHGTIAYVEQSPWIMNDTFRENILFGREYDENLYWRVVYSCALMSDIGAWPEGDLTPIGDRGINISGGQKARLALARAVYAQADIYIFDDPLSAVDEQVKRHLMDHVIMSTGIIGDKLRIVSTNSNHIVPFSDQVVHLDKRRARIERQEPKNYEEVIQQYAQA